MLTYKESGVNIEEGYKSVKLIKDLVKQTYSKYVLNGLGSFAGMVELPEGYKKPVLISGTDELELNLISHVKRKNMILIIIAQFLRKLRGNVPIILRKYLRERVLKREKRNY